MHKNDQTYFTGTLDRKEGRFFILTFPDGQELTVPIHFFSKNVHEGDIIHLNFMTDKQAKSERTELAKSLLEEILNGK